MIERLSPPVADADLRDLAGLLVDAVESGAAVSFLAPLTVGQAEEAACQAGFTLLTLDAKLGGAAERLYRRQGWTQAGTIPRYALDTDGVTPHDAVLFYKEIEPGRTADQGTSEPTSGPAVEGDRMVPP